MRCCCSRLKNAGASVKDLMYERAFTGMDVSAVNITCTIETNDHGHARSVQRQLRENDIHICRDSS
jgi:hypothetical protein